MILAATGLKHEARIISRPGVIAIAGGGVSETLSVLLDEHAPHADAIISIGLAGALDPSLRPGDWIIDTDDIAWRQSLLARLPTAHIGRIVGSDQILATADAKCALRRESHASACDMESHVAKEIAVRHQLPFAIMRVVSDDASTSLPPAALIGMRQDGAMDIVRVIASIARSPRQLPLLIRVALDARIAFRSLLRGYHMLARVGIRPADLGEFPLDMA